MKKKYPQFLYECYDRWCSVNYLLPWKRSKLHDKRNKIAPFFIVGSGRSGTTLLRRILIQNPAVHIPPETYVLGRLVRIYKQNAGLKWPLLVNLVLSTFEYHKDFYTFNISLAELSRQLKNCPKEKQTLAYILDCFYRFHAEKNGTPCTLWGDKTPQNSFHLENLIKVFPNAKFIFLIRNGYDVTYSYYKNNMYDTCYEATMRWKESNENVLRFRKKYPHKVFSIKYEDMVSDAEKYVPSIFSFLNVHFEKSYLKVTQRKKMGDVEALSHHYNIQNKINNTSVGKGKRKIPEDQFNLVEPLIESMNSLLEYD